MENLLWFSSANEKPWFFTQNQKTAQSKSVLSSRTNEVLVVLDVEEPECMSTEDVDIPPLDFYEVIEEYQVLPVYA